MLWFLWTSYTYIGPIGFIEHVEFFWRLPWATYRFVTLMRTDRQDTAWEDWK